MADEQIIIRGGRFSEQTNERAEFFQEFWSVYLDAVMSIEKVDIEPSVISDNTFYLLKVDGGCLIIKPLDQQIFEGDSGFQITSLDFALSYVDLQIALEELEYRLYGEITVEVINTSPLSEANEGLIVSLFYYTDLMIDAGHDEFEAGFCVIRDRTLYIKRESGNFIAVKHSGQKFSQDVFDVDKDFNPSPYSFSIDVIDLEVMVDEIRRQLILAKIIKPEDF